jgi:hypothetical protein
LSGAQSTISPEPQLAFTESWQRKLKRGWSRLDS